MWLTGREATEVQVEMQDGQSWPVTPSPSAACGPEPNSPPIQHITQPWERLGNTKQSSASDLNIAVHSFQSPYESGPQRPEPEHQPNTDFSLP